MELSASSFQARNVLPLRVHDVYERVEGEAVKIDQVSIAAGHLDLMEVMVEADAPLLLALKGLVQHHILAGQLLVHGQDGILGGRRPTADRGWPIRKFSGS